MQTFPQHQKPKITRQFRQRTVDIEASEEKIHRQIFGGASKVLLGIRTHGKRVVAAAEWCSEDGYILAVVYLCTVNSTK